MTRKEQEENQTVTEDPAAQPSAPTQEAATKADEALEEARALAEDYKRKWYAVSAEYENYRKRTKSDCAKRYAEGRADVVSKLFPIADDLGRALAACSDEGTRKGISMVIDTFGKLLDGEQIQTIDPLGCPFDAEKMEAVMAVEPVEGEVSGTVREVYRKGYEQNGRVLRFAQVVVTK